jgi:hypothetical protein
VQACQWVKETKMIDWLFIVGHYPSVNCGCKEGMATPQVYDLLMTMDGCSQMASRSKWFAGHQHNNQVAVPNVGFILGGAGMNDRPATFGVPFISTFNNRLQVYNFHIAYANETGDDSWSALMDCVNQNGGLHQCTHLAETFLDQPLSP